MNKRSFYVYVLYRPDGTPFYVGRGTGARWLCHERNAQVGKIKGNPEKHSLILRILRSGQALDKRKYATGLTTKAASSLEIRLIKRWKRIVDGGWLLNKTTGGQRGIPGHKHSAATRLKMSKSMRGIKRSPASRRRMSLAQKGRSFAVQVRAMRTANTGRPLSKEHRRKLSLAKKGRPHSRAHVAKLRGQKRSEAACKNMSKAMFASYRRRAREARNV